jgi:hypothetical protein
MAWRLVEVAGGVCHDLFFVRGRGGITVQKRFRALAVALAVIAVAIAAASQAAAGSAIPVSGTYVVSDFGTTSCVSVGASGFKFRCDTTGLVSQYSGDLTGTAVADFTSLIDCKAGRETGHGTETFTGSLVGVGSGTLSWIDQFSSNVDCSFAPDLFIPFNLDINSVAVRGSGGFAGLQGRLTFTDTTFTGVLH